MEIEILNKLSEDRIPFQIKYTPGKGFISRAGEYTRGSNNDIVAHNDYLKNAILSMGALASRRHPLSEFAKWWKEQQGNKNVSN